MKTVVVCDIYGLGGFALSPGMLTLAEKIKWLGVNFVVLGPYNQTEWETAAAVLAKRPESDLIGIIGYSLGANNAVQLAARLPRKVDYLAGIQASYWGAGVSWSGTIMLPPNVGYALGILQSVLHFHVRAGLRTIRNACGRQRNFAPSYQSRSALGRGQ